MKAAMSFSLFMFCAFMLASLPMFAQEAPQQGDGPMTPEQADMFARTNCKPLSHTFNENKTGVFICAVDDETHLRVLYDTAGVANSWMLVRPDSVFTNLSIDALPYTSLPRNLYDALRSDFGNIMDAWAFMTTEAAVRENR